MTVVTTFVVFQVIWWVVFLMALPFGVETESEPTKGFADSAPKNPMLRQKIYATTLISFILTGLVAWLLT
jgi:predicted secreted protein